MRLLLVVAELWSTSAVLTARNLRAGGLDDEPMTFEEFMTRYDRKYIPGTTEFIQRQALFETTRAQVMEQNRKADSWKAEVNKFADWTETELARLRGFKRQMRPSGGSPLQEGTVPTKLAAMQMRAHPVPEMMSWKHLEAVKQSRDQGACGSCWAFSANVAMRARAELNGGLQNFSVSQVVECTPNPQHCGGAGRCDGATVELAYEYVLKHGAKTEEEMPYPRLGEYSHQSSCPSDSQENDPSATVGVFLTDGREAHLLDQEHTAQHMHGADIGMIGWSKLPENQLLPIMEALLEGPVAVAVVASNNWNSYQAGIMSSKECDRDFIVNHAVTLIGYAPKYWQIKNSWGNSWGENGNIRLQRISDEENHCGWDKEPLVGVGCMGGPSQVKVCGSCGVLYDAVVPHFLPKDGVANSALGEATFSGLVSFGGPENRFSRL
mmetsp:Transcript_43194/g.92169  ORF Transcript_43194/g.92169 Transcript_43194/m.92169 type:complete len:437 (-) Transcript_43194:89-1399(-)